MGTVAHIFVAPAKRAPMQAVASVEALMDHGLRGDRHAGLNQRRPEKQVTLIELENIEAFVRETGLPLSPEMPRRNIVTRGVRLNELVGRRFTVGSALLEGVQLCEPCGLFAKLTHREVLGFFAGRGGLRARVISGGAIQVGDSIGAQANEYADGRD